jgi:hypothetical protein
MWQNSYTLHGHNLSSSRLLCPHPARTAGSGSPLSCRFFIPGEPRNKNAAPKLGSDAVWAGFPPIQLHQDRGVGGEGAIYARAKYSTVGWGLKPQLRGLIFKDYLMDRMILAPMIIVDKNILLWERYQWI